MSSALKIRTATAEDDRSSLAAVVNAAFEIETFIDGTRTDEQDLDAWVTTWSCDAVTGTTG